jgi:hypothetical protein
MELPKVTFSQQCQKIRGGRATVSNALRTTRSTCLPILLIRSVANLVIVSWAQPSIEGNQGEFGRRRLLKKIDAFMRLSDFNDEPRIIPSPE